MPLEWAPRSIDSPLSHYLPPLDLFLEAHKRSVETTRDAAALIDSVRLCYDAKRRIPAWIVKRLEHLLAEFVNVLTPRKRKPELRQFRRRFTIWGHQYFAAFCDWKVAEEVEFGIREMGLTHAEALDRAACNFRGTQLKGSVAALKEAWKRARRRAQNGWFQRPETKTKRDRVVPISTRLKAILEMRRLDPAGEALPPEAYVFGNALGQRTKSIKTAWKLACQRAGLVNFRFHDLRREAGSRWIEGGMVLHEVRDFLGHTKVSQTDVYLGANADRLHEALKRFEAHRTDGTGSTTTRNETATDVETGVTGSRGQTTAAKSDDEDRSENTQSVVN